MMPPPVGMVKWKEEILNEKKGLITEIMFWLVPADSRDKRHLERSLA